MHVVVIGGGAAGFFASISAAEHHPQARVTLLEKSNKPLAKVRISGGGRCNVTHAAPAIGTLVQHYPRGARFLRKAFAHFGQRETVAWFTGRGVELKQEADGRMFPITDDSATIVDLLLRAARQSGVVVRYQAAVVACRATHPGYALELVDGTTLTADRVIVTTGGHPKPDGYRWLQELGLRIVPPVPSLFTFNMPGDPVRDLMGVVVDPVRVRIIGTDLASNGPVLITHWGMSGPAILRLSAWGARAIHDMGYAFTLQVNWLGGRSEHEVRAALDTMAAELDRKQARNADPFHLPKRHWAYLLEKAGIHDAHRWGALAKRDRNRLIDLLTNDRYAVKGRTTFKEEFVTAGGVDLEQVDPNTMECRSQPGLFLAGEVLNIDGITGGFNFQAAWTTGHLAGKQAGKPAAQ